MLSCTKCRQSCTLGEGEVTGEHLDKEGRRVVLRRVRDCIQFPRGCKGVSFLLCSFLLFMLFLSCSFSCLVIRLLLSIPFPRPPIPFSFPRFLPLHSFLRSSFCSPPPPPSPLPVLPPSSSSFSPPPPSSHSSSSSSFTLFSFLPFSLPFSRIRFLIRKTINAFFEVQRRRSLSWAAMYRREFHFAISTTESPCFLAKMDASVLINTQSVRRGVEYCNFSCKRAEWGSGRGGRCVCVAGGTGGSK